MTEIPRYRPGYAHGASIPLSHARWVFENIVTSVSLSDDGKSLRLIAGDEHLDLIASWGVAMHDPLPTGRIVSLLSNIEANMESIAAWEAAHPDEPRIGTSRQAA